MKVDLAIRHFCTSLSQKTSEDVGLTFFNYAKILFRGLHIHDRVNEFICTQRERFAKLRHCV